jgi:hypothetical protein
LGTGEPTTGPSEGLNAELVLGFEERIFLFNTEPGMLILNSVKDLCGKVSEVSVSRLLVGEVFVGPDVSITEDNDVVTSSEGILE